MQQTQNVQVLESRKSPAKKPWIDGTAGKLFAYSLQAVIAAVLGALLVSLFLGYYIENHAAPQMMETVVSRFEEKLESADPIGEMFSQFFDVEYNVKAILSTDWPSLAKSIIHLSDQLQRTFHTTQPDYYLSYVIQHLIYAKSFAMQAQNMNVPNWCRARNETLPAVLTDCNNLSQNDCNNMSKCQWEPATGGKLMGFLDITALVGADMDGDDVYELASLCTSWIDSYRNNFSWDDFINQVNYWQCNMDNCKETDGSDQGDCSYTYGGDQVGCNNDSRCKWFGKDCTYVSQNIFESTANTEEQVWRYLSRVHSLCADLKSAYQPKNLPQLTHKVHN